MSVEALSVGHFHVRIASMHDADIGGTANICARRITCVTEWVARRDTSLGSTLSRAASSKAAATNSPSDVVLCVFVPMFVPPAHAQSEPVGDQLKRNCRAKYETGPRPRPVPTPRPQGSIGWTPAFLWTYGVLATARERLEVPPTQRALPAVPLTPRGTSNQNDVQAASNRVAPSDATNDRPHPRRPESGDSFGSELLCEQP